MADIIRMPEVLAGAEEAAIQTWLVEPGAVVAIHQALAEIETDKAIVELTAETGGIIGRLLVPEGDSVAVGDPIIVMLASGETDEHIERALSEIGVASQSAPAAEPASAAAPAPAAERAAAPAADGDGDGRRLFASPLVRRLAAQSGVAIGDIQGTGPQGRIVRRDLEKHLAQAASAAPPADAHPAPVATPASSAPTPQPAVADASHQDVPLDRMRKAIARRLTESKSSVPHFYLVADCRVDALLQLRRSVNEAAPRKISVNDFVLKAVAGALVEVPAANAIWNGDSIRTFSSVDLSVAVATEGGLTTPVLRSVERMPLTHVSATVAELAERARAGRLKQHELEGGSFSVSNLGMYGTSEFSAILNPPQSGILAVGAARPMPVVDETGQLAVGQVMTVTLSADHRVLDGAVAAQWLAAFQRRIENPLTILI